ncbi:MAG: phasin family protein [Sphingopyxis sp.]
MATRNEVASAENAYANASADAPAKVKRKPAKGAAKAAKTADAVGQSTVAAAPSTIPPVAAAPAAAHARKGQTMIAQTVTKFTEEATKVAAQAKARTETLVADMQERAQTAAAKGQELTKDAVEFSKGNVEAVVEAGKIAAKGMETMGQDFVTYAKQSMEDSSAAAKRFAEVKTPAEFFQLQSELAKSTLDALVKHGSKTTETSVKLANEAFQPISNRIALAVAKLKTAA